VTAPTSLRLRLLALGAVSILIALIVAGVFILTSFSASIDVERRADLQARLDRLTAVIDPNAVELTSPDPLSDPRYDTPLSGIYWQIDDLDAGSVVRSRSLWDQRLPLASGDGKPQLAEVAGPDQRRLIVLSRLVSMNGTDGVRHFNAAVAEARDLDDDPIQRFGFNLVAALLVLGAVLIAAEAVQVHFGLRPLGTLRRQIVNVRQGNAHRLPQGGAQELVPVVEEINELLDAQEATITFARDRATDLAHGLKTPLAVLSASAARLRESGARSDADLLQMLADQMNERIDYQLRIARLRFRTRAQGTNSSINETVLRSVAVLRKGPGSDRLNWGVDLQEHLEANIDAHDLMELVGIVLENACKWAESQVMISATRRDGLIELTVEDDGAGVGDEQISRLGQRGARLDETKPGEGIGLAIAFEIVRLNHGSIIVSRSHLGGLHASIVLPSAYVRANAQPTGQSRVLEMGGSQR
jgi:signal transduction histidine kinase